MDFREHLFRGGAPPSEESLQEMDWWTVNDKLVRAANKLRSRQMHLAPESNKYKEANYRWERMQDLLDKTHNRAKKTDPYELRPIMTRMNKIMKK